MPKGVYQHERIKPIIRFRSFYKVIESGCWEWRGGKIRSGYGVFWDGDKNVLSHRWSYLNFVGIIPSDREIDHLCRNRACCNPAHLEAVTRSVNGIRGLSGKHRLEEAKLITHCPKGHEYNSDNTIIRPTKYGGSARNCRQCTRIRRAKQYIKNREREKQYQRDFYLRRKLANSLKTLGEIHV